MGKFCPSYQQRVKYYFFFFFLKQLAMKPFNNITEKVRERISHFLSKQVADITSCLPGMRGTEDLRLHLKLTGTLAPLVKGGLGWQWLLMGARF